MGCVGSLQRTHVKQAPKLGRTGEGAAGPVCPGQDGSRSPGHCSCASSVRRREELQSTQAAWLSQAEQYENSHLGGYRRIYPACGTDKYEPFFKQSSSLFQETVSSKAREECARYTAPAETPFTGWHLLLIPLGDSSVLRRCNWAGESWKGRRLHVPRHPGKATSTHTLERQMRYPSDLGTLGHHVAVSSPFGQAQPNSRAVLTAVRVSFKSTPGPFLGALLLWFIHYRTSG